MCLLGSVQGQEVTILVDSGSSHTFISENLASVLEGVVPSSAHLNVQVANGQKLQCQFVLPHAKWSVNNHVFIQTSKCCS
jgi:predicted aspartyl protease